MMQLGHIEIFVRDPVGSLRFYRDVLGFEVEVVQQETFVWLKAGETTLLLRPGPGAAPAESYQRAPIALVIYSDDLPAALARLAEHGIAIRGDDGPGCATFCDPDGHWLQLVDPATK